MADDALALVELSSVARGLRALDALIKRAPVTILEANLVEPGHYLILFCGGVAEVDESYAEARAVGDGAVLDHMMLPFAHPDLLVGLRGRERSRSADALDTLGVLEGTSVAATLVAADQSLKEAAVELVGVRVGVGLGGRAWYVVCGAQHDVEASLEAGGAALDAAGARHAVEIIARPHDEMVPWLLRRPPFSLAAQEP
jgi:microcompartment protein CcmL/EutN